MKIDIYTKVVMTVIAVSLVKIAFTDVLINPAFARGSVQKIAICGEDGRRCARVRSSGLRIEPN